VVDAHAIDRALDAGTSRVAMMRGYRDHRDAVKGSPHFFLADGGDLPNPGIEMHWVGKPGAGFIVIDHDDAGVYDDLVRRAAAVPTAPA
jgi:hypothetical protein